MRRTSKSDVNKNTTPEAPKRRPRTSGSVLLPANTFPPQSSPILTPDHKISLVERLIIKSMKGATEKHKFWDAQPMPRRGDSKILPEGPIVSNEDHTSNLRETPYPLPSHFCWADVDASNPQHLKDLHKLLHDNYGEDIDGIYHTSLTEPFLHWALTAPGSRPDFCVGVRTNSSDKLVAFIAATSTCVRVKTSPSVQMANVDFLCIHKKLQDKRLAPVLMKEIKRRINLAGIFQAIFMTGHPLSMSMSTSHYYHRELNPMKLADIGFTGTEKPRLGKKYKIPVAVRNAGLRPMTKADVEGVHALLSKYLESTFQWHIVFTQDEIDHLLLPREGVVTSYVVSNTDGEITDLCSFMHSPSTVIGRKDTMLNQVYSLYNVATTMSLTDLLRDTLVLAKQCGIDVFNCTDVMENKAFIEDLKFFKGDGELHYYLYNWSCGQMMAPKDVGLVPTS